MVALSIAITVAMFTLVDTVLLKPLPYPDPDRLVTVMEANPAAGQQTSLIAPGRLEDWNRNAGAFVALSGYYSDSVTDASGPEPVRLSGRRVAPRYFTVFGASPLVGRTFVPEEERFGGPAVAIISEGFWTRRYGRAPDVLTRALLVDGVRYAIVGVMPATFAPESIDVWLPAQTPPGLLRVRQARYLSGVARMKPGISLPLARADLANVEEALGRQYPATDKGWSIEIVDLKEARIGAHKEALWLLFGGVALLFLIALANIAGLMLIQLHRQARSLAIRQAIGGSRAQIVAGLMSEVLLITAAGVAAGCTAAWWLTRAFARAFVTLPRINELGVDWRVLLFAAVAAGGSAILFGLVPVLQVTTRDSAAWFMAATTRVTIGRHSLQQSLVIAQIALGLPVVVSAGLLIRTYHNLTHVDAGFRSTNAITFHLGATWNEDRTRIGEMQEQLVTELQRQPDIIEAGLTNFLPATGATLRYQIKLEGTSANDESAMPTVGERTVSTGYLRALSVPLLAGSWCPPLRRQPRIPAPALVNRAFADRFGPHVIGRRFAFDQVPGDHEIVGIVGNTIEDGPRSSAAPYLYACQPAGEWPDPNYVVLGRGDSRQAIARIREVVHRIAPTRALFGLRLVDDAVAESLDQPRWNAAALSLFGIAAILLAAVGLYGMLMLLLAERTREVGIRIALGATPVDVAMLMFRFAGRTTTAGLIVGLVLAWATTRLLDAALFSVGTFDLATIATTVATFCVVALIATAVPAARAVATDSIRSIRAE